MYDRKKALVILLVLTTGLAVQAVDVSAYENGITGHSGRDQGATCGTCHSGGRDAQVTLEGPTSVAPGMPNTYSVKIHAKDTLAAGLNVSASDGRLIATEVDTRLQDNELIHTQPRAIGIDGKVTFFFDWNAPDKPGDYILAAAGLAVNRLGDKAGDHAGQATIQVTVDESAEVLGFFDKPPVAHLGGPYMGRAGTSILFDGSLSYDMYSEIVEYEWDFGDGTARKGSSKIQHSYDEPGIYIATLTLTDDEGLKDIAAAVVEVTWPVDRKNAPVPVTESRRKGSVGEAIHFDASKSRDPDGEIIAYHWEFGDGTVGKGVELNHVYGKEGIYLGNLIVTDNDGVPSNQNFVVVINGMNYPNIVDAVAENPVNLNKGNGNVTLGHIAISTSLLEPYNPTQVCGSAIIERDDIPYASESFCFNADGKRILMFRVLYSESDVPSVIWKMYIVLDSGLETEPVTRSVSVVMQ